MYEKELIGLAESEARYLVIGGIAVGLQGYPRLTFDLDILPDLTSENLEKIIATLTRMDYKPRVPVDAHDLKDPVKRTFWYREKNMKVFTFFHRHDQTLAVDLMIYSPLNFEEAFQRRMTMTLERREIYVASLEDLISLKRQAGRNKDIIDIQFLERLVERRSDD